MSLKQKHGENASKGMGNGRVLTCASLGLFPIMQHLLQGREQLQELLIGAASFSRDYAALKN
jgi:hypothetical protein